MRGRRFKLLYATLAREEMSRPIMAPRVVLFVNHEDLMTPTYRRYLENTVRGSMKYEGLPIRFDVRAREKRQGSVKDLWKPATRGTGGRQGRRKEDEASGKKERQKDAQRRVSAERSGPPREEGTAPSAAPAKRPAAKRPASKRPASKRPSDERTESKRPTRGGPAAKRPAAKRPASKRPASKKTDSKRPPRKRQAPQKRAGKPAAPKRGRK